MVNKILKAICTVVFFGTAGYGTAFMTWCYHYIKEWSFHNCAYRNRELAAFYLGKDVNQVKISSKDVDLNTNDLNGDIYEKNWRCCQCLLLKMLSKLFV